MTRICAIDTETTGLIPFGRAGCQPFMVAAAFEDEPPTVWEFPVDPVTRQVLWSRGDAGWRKLRRLLQDPGIEKTFFNSAFDLRMLAKIALEVRGKLHDAQFKVICCYNTAAHVGLKELAKKYLDFGDEDREELRRAVVTARRVGKRLGWSLAEDIEADYWMPAAVARLAPGDWPAGPRGPQVGAAAKLAAKYCANDAERTLRLDALFDHGLDKMRARQTYELEMRLAPIIRGMIDRGVQLDKKAVGTARWTCAWERDKAMKQIVRLTGASGINMNSPKQVADALFGGDKPRLEAHDFSPNGMPRTGAEALMPYRGDPLVDAILKYRANDKAITSFFDAYKKLATIDKQGRMFLHAGFRQLGTVTGRFSCGQPNLQQVSDPTTSNSRAAEHVVNVRRSFVPRAGFWWAMYDYKTVEVIIFADLSGEPSLRDAILRGEDVHGAAANRAWGGEGNEKAVLALLSAARGVRASERDAPPSKRTAAAWELQVEADAVRLLEAHGWRVVEAESAIGSKTVRKKAKSVVFTKIFGGGPNALMSWVGCDRQEAVRMLHEFDDAFPEMRERMAEIESRGRKRGFVRNPFGRRIAFNPHASYTIVNHYVQSTAADLMKRGLVRSAEWLAEAEVVAFPVLTVHDEIAFEIRRDHAIAPVLRQVRDLMSDHGGALGLPTPVDVEIVEERWSEKRKATL